MAFDLGSFEADVAALVAREAAVLTPDQLSQIQTIAQQTFASATADAAAGKDPIPDVVAGLNRIDAVINAPAPCFASGTRIRTSDGSKLVEHLAVGDLVATLSGAMQPIVWLGHRTIDCRRVADPKAFMPVRIAAHAFGENRPTRDLVVSPGHALCFDVLGDVLIRACELVNGATIVRDQVDTVTYWHVELEQHDILFAEDMPAESYLEMNNRRFFTEADVVDMAALPDAAPVTTADFCRPLHHGDALVEAVRGQLAMRAEKNGWSLVTPDRLSDIHLVVDGKRIDGVLRGTSARFSVPADARDVWLMSETYVPRNAGQNPDNRHLGLYVSRVVIDDGFEASVIVHADDARFADGFQPAEAGPARWTDGRARLPAELWAGLQGDFFLRIDLAGVPQQVWRAPAASGQAVALAA